ncbi:hypothetical protein CHUAL_013339 [Chamberlinius hualienensis]
MNRPITILAIVCFLSVMMAPAALAQTNDLRSLSTILDTVLEPFKLIFSFFLNIAGTFLRWTLQAIDVFVEIPKGAISFFDNLIHGAINSIPGSNKTAT